MTHVVNTAAVDNFSAVKLMSLSIYMLLSNSVPLLLRFTLIR